MSMMTLQPHYERVSPQRDRNVIAGEPAKLGEQFSQDVQHHSEQFARQKFALSKKKKKKNNRAIRS